MLYSCTMWQRWSGRQRFNRNITERLSLILTRCAFVLQRSVEADLNLVDVIGQETRLIGRSRHFGLRASQLGRRSAGRHALRKYLQHNFQTFHDDVHNTALANSLDGCEQ